MEKTARTIQKVTAVLKADTAEALKRSAKQQNRSVSNLCACIIEDYLRRERNAMEH
jgi:hypothetical protein